VVILFDEDMVYNRYKIIVNIMSSILKKAKDYKRVSSVLYEGEAHLNDKFTSKP